MPRERKTLTERDIQSLYESGLEVVLKKGRYPAKYSPKGETTWGIYYPDLNQARVYLAVHNSKKEITASIIHEFVHALEGTRGFREKISKGKIEEIVERTLKRRPKIGDLIKAVFSVEY